MKHYLEVVLRVAFAALVVVALGYGTLAALGIETSRAASCPPCDDNGDCDPLECCEAGFGGVCHLPSGTCICL